MFFVYAIKSITRNYIYVGLTNNLDRRLAEHNRGKNKTTKPYKPFELTYSEVVKNRIETRIRKKHFKSGIGKEFLKKLILSKFAGMAELVDAQDLKSCVPIGTCRFDSGSRYYNQISN